MNRLLNPKLLKQKCVVWLTALLLSFATNQALATETDTWMRSNEASTAQIDHSKWQAILARYLDTQHASGVNLFDYRGVKEEDRKQLQVYLQDLQKIDPRSYRKAEQKAYWINLYNALTVDLILKHYPVKSITKLGSSFFAFGPWDDDIAVIAGHTLTLNDIEHKILRPIWRDPRLHYAVNCASYSCPNLAADAYTSGNLESLLERGAKSYVNHARGVTVEGEDLKLSSIYKWYQEDFGNEAQLIQHLIHYAEPELKKRLQHFKAQGGDLDFDYNWGLNERR